MEFDYNNLIYTFIGITPFQANKAKILFKGKGLKKAYRGSVLKYAKKLANKLKTIHNKLRPSLVKV